MGDVLKVQLTDLQIGQRLGQDVFEEHADGRCVLLFARGQVIRHERHLQRLRDAGCSEVIVDEHGGRLEAVRGNSCAEEILNQFLNLRDQIDMARQNELKTIQELDSIFLSVRQGENPGLQKLEDNLLQSIQYMRTGPDLTMALMRMRQGQPYIYRHSLAVTWLLVRLAMYKHPNAGDAEMLHYGLAGMLHDVGFMHCGELQQFRGDCLNENTDELRMHTEFGLVIVREMKGIAGEIRRAVVEHHERFNGSGYPQGLHQEEIHPLSYDVGICDAFDSLVTDTPYRRALSPGVGMALLQGWAGREFPTEVVREFTSCFGRWPVGEAVELSDGRRGVVAMRGGQDAAKPVIAVQHGKQMEMVDVSFAGVEISRGLRQAEAPVAFSQVF